MYFAISAIRKDIETPRTPVGQLVCRSLPHASVFAFFGFMSIPFSSLNRTHCIICHEYGIIIPSTENYVFVQ